MAQTMVMTQARSYIQRYGNWAFKVSSALADQAFFSGSNFIINVLLARWLSPDEYGAYVVAYTWFLLAQNLYDGMLVEPMAVFGAGKYTHRLRGYLKYMMVGHIIISLLIFVVLFAGALFQHTLSSSALYAALLGAAVTAPFMLMRWLTRQPFYIISKPHLVIASGAMYTAFSVAGLFALHQLTPTPTNPFLCSGEATACTLAASSTQTSVFWAQIVLGIAALIPSLYNIWLLTRRVESDDQSAPQLHTRNIIVDHFNFGKWSVPSRLMLWAAGQLQYLALPLLFGLAGTASLRALNNLVLPVYLSIGAIGAIMMPSFVRVAKAGGKKSLDQKVRIVSFISIGVCGVYSLIVIVFGDRIMHLIYDAKYNDAATLANLFFLGSAPLLGVLGVVYSIALKALERFKESVYFNVVSAILTVTVGLLLTLWLGILGAAISSFISQLVALAVIMRAYYFSRPRPAAPKAESSPEAA